MGNAVTNPYEKKKIGNSSINSSSPNLNPSASNQPRFNTQVVESSTRVIQSKALLWMTRVEDSTTWVLKRGWLEAEGFKLGLLELMDELPIFFFS